jgi:pyruvate,water dikinase
LSSRGIKVPDGFATTADAYREFLAESGLDREVRRILMGCDARDVDDLRRRGAEIRHAILAAELPPVLERRSPALTHGYAAGSGRGRSTSRSAAAPRPKTSPMPASPASRKPT